MKGGKPPITHLEILTILSNNPGTLLARRAWGGLSGNITYSFVDSRGKHLDELSKLFDNVRQFHVRALEQKNYVTTKSVPWEHSRYNDTFYQITEKGREIAMSQKERLAEYKEEKEEERKRVDRLVIIRDSKATFGYLRFAALGRVVKETATRYYIDDDYLTTEGTRGSYVFSIHGQRGRRYIDKDDVEVDQASEELFRRLVKIENAHKSWLSDLERAEEEEIEPIRKRFMDRRKQQVAAVEDAVIQTVKMESEKKA